MGKSLSLQDQDTTHTLTPQDVVDIAVNDYGRQDFYGLCSGGKDSVSVCHWFSTNYPELFKGILFCDTTIGIPDTRKFVEKLCKEQGWELHISTPRIGAKYDKNGKCIKQGKPFTYREWVMEYGFPTQRAHRYIMGYLKYQPMRNFIKEKSLHHGCLISGVRRKESKRRMKTVKGAVLKEGRLHFCQPFVDKTSPWVFDYLNSHDLHISPVYQTMHYSGDCLCGAYAKPEEINLLKGFYPDMAKKLADLEKELAKSKNPNVQKYLHWGNNVGFDNLTNQETLEESLVCTDCMNDAEARNSDAECFVKELEDIDDKLNTLSTN